MDFAVTRKSSSAHIDKFYSLRNKVVYREMHSIGCFILSIPSRHPCFHCISVHVCVLVTVCVRPYFPNAYDSVTLYFIPFTFYDASGSLIKFPFHIS